MPAAGKARRVPGGGRSWKRSDLGRRGASGAPPAAAAATAARRGEEQEEPDGQRGSGAGRPRACRSGAPLGVLPLPPSASANSAAVAKRSAGSLASAVSTASSIASGHRVARARRRGGLLGQHLGDDRLGGAAE